MGGALLSALSKRPSRLFDNNDGALTMMLWGVEKSTQRLQAALTRGAHLSTTNATSTATATASNASDVALCLQKDGVVQGYRVVPTEQLPAAGGLGDGFSPAAVGAGKSWPTGSWATTPRL